MSPSPLPIFDGHNDTLLRLYRKGLAVSSFFTQGEEGHLDLPRARQGGFAGGLFACFVPSDAPDEDLPAPERGGYSVPFPGTPSRERALAVTTALAARLQRLERASDGAVTACLSARRDPRRHGPWKPRRGAAHRGCRGDRSRARRAGGPARRRLRSLGPVWSRPNLFGHGVPFRFPSSPDTAPASPMPARRWSVPATSSG